MRLQSHGDLAEISAASGYVIVVTSALFSGRGATRLYAFACPPKSRWGRIMLVVESESETKREVGESFEEVK